MDDDEEHDDLDLIGPPNCPSCLEPMAVAGSITSPRWECPRCHLVALN